MEVAEPPPKRWHLYTRLHGIRFHKTVILERDNVWKTLTNIELNGGKRFPDLFHKLLSFYIDPKRVINSSYFLFALKPLTFTSITRGDHNLNFLFKTLYCSQTPTDGAKLRLREEIVGSNFLQPHFTQHLVILSRDLWRRRAVSWEWPLPLTITCPEVGSCRVADQTLWFSGQYCDPIFTTTFHPN